MLEDGSNNDDGSPAWLAFLNMPPCLLLLSTLIPISLLVSVEFIRLGHSLLINWDLDIYHRYHSYSPKPFHTIPCTKAKYK